METTTQDDDRSRYYTNARSANTVGLDDDDKVYMTAKLKGKMNQKQKKKQTTVRIDGGKKPAGVSRLEVSQLPAQHKLKKKFEFSNIDKYAYVI